MEQSVMQRRSLKLTVGRDEPAKACDFLARETGLAKARIKDAMAKGAVILRRGKSGKRLRRATAALRAGDVVSLHYDAEILTKQAPAATLVEDRRDYSVWNKPAGLLAQGTKFGDHCALLRQVEQYFKSKRQVFLVHRLDREASGLMLVAHNKKAAALLSGLFQQNKLEKAYQAEILGSPGQPGASGVLEEPLDGKPARTLYTVQSINPATGNASLALTIETGRLHQIRRHLDLLGHPVLGDPRYGTGNGDSRGLQLTAVALRFVCPLRKQMVAFVLPGF